MNSSSAKGKELHVDRVRRALVDPFEKLTGLCAAPDMAAADILHRQAVAFRTPCRLTHQLEPSAPSASEYVITEVPA